MARKMKDSGIEWIGEIPEGWEVCRLKNIVACRDELRKPISADKRENHLKLYDYYGASGVIDTIDDYNVDGTVLLIGEDGANLKLRNLPLIYRASGKFWVNNHAHILIVNKKHSYDYVAYLLEAGDYSNYITGSAQPKLSQFNLMRFPVAIPNYTEQENISFFIHRECSKIDSILSETRSSIEEYKKLKQAVITQAVTKGVRGEREMKDSGNPWFGQIPTDWKLSRVGLHFSIILGKMLCNAPLNDTYTLEPYYCAADVHFDGVADGERKKMWFSPIEKDLYRVSVGDLLVVEGGAGAGGSAIVEKQDSDTYVQNSIMIVRSKGNADNRYLRYLLEFLVKQGYIGVVCNKATIPHFTKDKLSCVPFCLCGEQEEIADYLDAKCAEIDKLIAKKEQLVKELESYKKSLIYEVVTGKREV